MTLALLYDMHGNLLALEAVIEDAEAAGAGRFVLGGDYAAFGAWPRETVERLKQLDAEWIRGNVDRWTVDPSDAPDPVRPALGICRELLGEELAAELAALPPTLSGDGVLYCHGSPGSDVESFMPEPQDGEDGLLAGIEAARVVFGHTHLQFTRTAANGVELLNPGSVGIPLDGDRRAAYALLLDDGRIELRRAEYDWETAAREVRAKVGELPAKRIEQSRFDVT
jgi:predicted phosphodiesterase